MPTPNTPSLVDQIAALEAQIAAQTVEIVNMAAALQALQDDLEIVANFQRLGYESTYGAGASTSGIWDGSDRYV